MTTHFSFAVVSPRLSVPLLFAATSATYGMGEAKLIASNKESMWPNPLYKFRIFLSGNVASSDVC